MTLDRRIIAAAFGIALAVSACGGSSTPAASDQGGEATTTEAPATEALEPTEAPEATEESGESGGGGPDISFAAGAAGDLEAKLPDEANGIRFQKGSFDGASIGGVGLPVDAGELQPLLDANGKSLSDVKVAIASPADASGGATTTVFAIQIAGLPADKILPVLDSSGSLDGMQDTTIAGKTVKTAGESPFTVGVYLKDDVVYYILFADDPTLEAIVGKLP